MDPKTGAVLAEASYPSYDANLYSEVASQNPSLFMDPIISEVYEPGSVFKMLTASAALQTKTTALSTMIDDTGVLKLPGGQEVADADRKAKGWMTFADIVAWSRNVGASRVAFRLGKTINAASAALYKTWQTYGIGQLTGIDLAGEVNGIVRDPATSPWQQIDLANASFGQGVAVTPIQIMRAYCTMANGGLSVTPHVAVLDQGTAAPSASSGARRVISASLSSSLTGLMEHVVTAVPSYHQATYIPGYYVGGKTGTAQIWDPTLNHGKGGWMDNIYNYSFYGWVGHRRARPGDRRRDLPGDADQGGPGRPGDAHAVDRALPTGRHRLGPERAHPAEQGRTDTAGRENSEAAGVMVRSRTGRGWLCDTGEVTDTCHWEPRPGAGPPTLTVSRIAARASFEGRTAAADARGRSRRPGEEVR